MKVLITREIPQSGIEILESHPEIQLDYRKGPPLSVPELKKAAKGADAIISVIPDSITEEIIKRGLKVKWSAWMELKHIPKHFLLLAIKAGCTSITFSPDAVSQSALNALQKELNEKDVKDSLKLFTGNKDFGDLNVTYSIFVNPPGETFTGILKTILFYLKAKLFLRGRGGPFLNWIRLEPETKAFQYALKKGIIKKHIDLLPDDESDLKNMFYSNPSLRLFDFLIIGMLKFLPMIKKLFSNGRSGYQ